MMKITVRISSLLFGLLFWSALAWAQPANDNCAGAFDVFFANGEANVVKTNGDTRGATQSTAPTLLCTGAAANDDIWFKFTTPSAFDHNRLTIKAYFNQVSTDVTALGMALYEGCGNNQVAIHCFSSNRPEDDKIELPTSCLTTDRTYFLRMWSIGSTTATSGTLQMGVYTDDYKVQNVLWEEKFDSDPFSRGWNTYGVCGLNPDSSANAVFEYFPNGDLKAGSFTPFLTIPSPSFCDGAIGVHSDFNDSNGTGAIGMGSVPTSTSPNGSTNISATYELESPSIFIGDWNVSGVSVEFHQGVRELRCDFSVSFRNRNTGDPAWGAWTAVPFNEELAANEPIRWNTVRRTLTNAVNSDSLQLKLTYVAHYYFWIIDDLQIVETECTNTVVGGRVGEVPFYAIAPWAMMPSNQVYPFPAAADIYNAGACTQTNVTLNHTIADTSGNVVYNEDLLYGDLPSDSLSVNRNFPIFVNVPNNATAYNGDYVLTQDMTDFDPTDNIQSYSFGVGGDAFALEDGATRVIAPATSNYDVGAPESYVYGNYFHPVADATVKSIEWGISNNAEMALAGLSVNVLLLEWSDTNGDEVSQSSERRYLSVIQHPFTGLEGDDVIISTLVENFDNPGDPVVLKAGFGYMAVIEFQANSSADPALFLLASDARDYAQTNVAFGLAFDAGMTDRKFYASVLGLAADGNVAEIDYNVGTNTFGFDIVPVVRIIVDLGTNTVDQLPLDNSITAYPNPATEQVQVKLEFDKPYSDVKLRLIDNLGRVVYFKALEQTISQYVETVSVRDLPSGNYLLQVETPDGQRSVPVVVVK